MLWRLRDIIFSNNLTSVLFIVRTDNLLHNKKQIGLYKANTNKY